MPTFVLPRFLETHQRRLEHARKLETVVRKTGGDVGGLRQAHTAVDGVALRGIPAVGRHWAGGAIRGTRPGDNLR